MGILNLLIAASMPVLKVLLVTALGLVLALDTVDLLGDNSRKQVNRIAFFVFNPALVASQLSKTITFDSILSLWYMPVNIFLTFVIGSALGWILTIITKAPRHLKGLILGVCSAGNLGNLPLVIVPALCKEKGSPFGDPDVCHNYGLAYASLSMAIGAVFIWTYVYNIVRVFSVSTSQSESTGDSIIKIKSIPEVAEPDLENLTEKLLPSKDSSSTDNSTLPTGSMDENVKTTITERIKEHLSNFSRHMNLKEVFAPSTTGAIVGFAIGTIRPLRKLLIGGTAPLRVLQDSASMLGDAAIPILTLIIGANLLRGVRGGSRMQPSIVVGIVVVRYVIMPLCGLFIIKGAIYLGLVHGDPLYQFLLLLQFALPPAMNIGTITQLFGVGETECSVIMLWTYGFASVALTLWSTFFMWIVA